MSFNQSEVYSVDQRHFFNECNTLITRLRNLCVKNSIGFSISDTPAIIGQKKVEFWMRDLIGSLEHWQKRNELYKQAGTTLFVFTDNFIEFEDLECVKFYSDPFLHFLCCTFEDDCNINSNPSKLYNCFIQRVDAVRQSWFYFLYSRGLLDQGHVSFLLKQLKSYSTLTGVDLFDFIHTKYDLGNLPAFSEAYKNLRPLVPYRNFVQDEDLSTYIKDSKYSLVLETFATDSATDRWVISEKAMRALWFPNVPLLFAQTRAVEKLRSIGFQIDYHDQIDTVPWVDKQRMLLDIIENDAIDIDYKHNYNRAMHNRAVGLAGKQRYQKNDYFDEFITKVLEH